LSFSRQHHLTTPQAELLAKYISNVPRQRIAEELGISDNTLKTRVRQLLAKAGAGTLELAYDAMVRG
jgi:DNA-binding NarL/FixJ family response regulator